MSGLLCLASAAVDVGNCLSILGEILDMCRLAKAGAMIRTAGIAYTTGTMAYLTGESMANTITLYIDNDYQITDEVAESAGLTVMSGLGTVMGYRALDGSIRQMQSLEAMGTYCFAAGTLVLTEDGFRNIEDIEPGDKVYSTDEETGESGYKEVLQVFVKETEVVTHVFYEVEQEDGEIRTEEIETTLNHLFWCEGEWKAAGTLKAGDLLTLADGSQVKVTEITYEDRHTTVYNMEVADYHTYYVGEDGVWVHNTDRCLTTGSGLSKESSDFGQYEFKIGIDEDIRGGKKSFGEAVEYAFEKTGIPREDFRVTRWGRNRYGKSYPVEWRAANGAEVNIDLGHSSTSGAPTIPHIGWQTGGKRSSGGGVRGHIFVDEVPYNR